MSMRLPVVVRASLKAWFVSFVSLFLSFVSLSSVAHAQPTDSIGIRAQGMSGAFTAVADDATATWWNPAGLATGAYFNAIVEYDRARERDESRGGFAVAFPALGLSYYRLPVSQIAPAASTGAVAVSRQDQGTADVPLRSLTVSQFGATAGQSIGQHLVVATTLKLLRGGDESRGGLDVGAMAVAGLMRAGVVVRNVRESTLGSGATAIEVRRQARAGVALTSAGQGSLGGVTLSVDGDLTKNLTATGEERRVAVGGEVWTGRRRLGIRAGVSTSTAGDSRTSQSVGASWALRSGVYVDGQLTGSSDETRRGWGLAARVTF